MWQEAFERVSCEKFGYSIRNLIQPTRYKRELKKIAWKLYHVQRYQRVDLNILTDAFIAVVIDDVSLFQRCVYSQPQILLTSIVDPALGSNHLICDDIPNSPRITLSDRKLIHPKYHKFCYFNGSSDHWTSWTKKHSFRALINVYGKDKFWENVPAKLQALMPINFWKGSKY